MRYSYTSLSINQHNQVKNTLPISETSITMAIIRPIFVLHSMTVVEM